jgi:hypothetical protein
MARTSSWTVHRLRSAFGGAKDFQGRDLIVTNEGDDLAIFEAGTSGNSTLYKLTVKQAIQKTKTTVSDTIYANTVDWQTWSKFNITFRMRAGASTGGPITVRAITPAVNEPVPYFAPPRPADSRHHDRLLQAGRSDEHAFVRAPVGQGRSCCVFRRQGGVGRTLLS